MSASTLEFAPRATDPHALLSTLYADYGPALQAYVTRLLSDPHQAEDVIQETMLRAWRNADVLVPERGSVAGWLMRVAHNIAVDKIRARKARPTRSGRTRTPPDPSTATPPRSWTRCASPEAMVRALPRDPPAQGVSRGGMG